MLLLSKLTSILKRYFMLWRVRHLKGRRALDLKAKPDPPAPMVLGKSAFNVSALRAYLDGDQHGTLDPRISAKILDGHPLTAREEDELLFGNLLRDE